MELKEILDMHEKFVIKELKGKGYIVPQAVVCKNKGLYVFLLMVGREETQFILKQMIAKAPNPDWVIFMNEAFMESFQFKKIEEVEEYKEEYRHGTLKERFDSGDETVREAVILVAYKKDGKLIRTIDKKTFQRIGEDMDNFEGATMISDVDRVLWGVGK